MLAVILAFTKKRYIYSGGKSKSLYFVIDIKKNCA